MVAEAVDLELVGDVEPTVRAHRHARIRLVGGPWRRGLDVDGVPELSSSGELHGADVQVGGAEVLRVRDDEIAVGVHRHVRIACGQGVRKVVGGGGDLDVAAELGTPCC